MLGFNPIPKISFPALELRIPIIPLTKPTQNPFGIDQMPFTVFCVPGLELVLTANELLIGVRNESMLSL